MILEVKQEQMSFDDNSNDGYYSPQRSCGKVMFSQASVILFTGGDVCVGGCAWQGARMAGGACMVGGMRGGGHGRRDGHCSRRYASY